MWDSDVSLEAQGMITVVMMLNGIFEWIAWRYGFLNGLQVEPQDYYHRILDVLPAD